MSRLPALPFRRRPKHALPDPWHRRPAVWVATALVVVLGACVARAAGGGDEDPFVAPAFNTTSTTVATTVPTTTTTTSTSTSTTTTTAAPAAECIAVANPSLLVTIAAEEASAVVTAAGDGWFVAKANGATWFTTADPTRDAEGDLVPMNDQARADSTSGRDLPPEDPRYRGHTDAEPEADAARACAAASPPPA